MATTSPRASPTHRRISSTSTTPPPSGPIARGATARSVAAPRVSSSLNSAVTRRNSLKATPSTTSGESREGLAISLKQEIEAKEQLLVQLQNKDQTITNLTTENDNLSSALSSAETRVNELYDEQQRAESEIANRIDISEKLRTQLKETEKEKRDLQRRYNEQTATFEAERQAFYDNEQHLKSRIQSLTQARKQPEPSETPTIEIEPETPDEIEHPRQPPETVKQDIYQDDTEPAEMTSLRLELSTLSTSYSSMQSTLVLLQTQLVDLKRVHHELQEENESFMILLREKTLSGQFDVRRQVGGTSISEGEEEDEDDSSGEREGSADVSSIRSIGRSTLDRVEEEEVFATSLEQELERSLQIDEDPRPSHRSRQGRKRTSSTSHSPHGESLANLPITGPGLDLGSELGRAAYVVDDITAVETEDQSILNKSKKDKKRTLSKKVSSAEIGGFEASGSSQDIDALRTEVKSLKDANKALSLYASKIIDRIIMEEGFEHVLAVDYDKPSPTMPASKSPGRVPAPPAAKSKTRPQSVIVGRSLSNPASSSNHSPSLSTSAVPASAKTQRRSLSFDWKGFSIFNGAEKKPEHPSLRPLTLKPGSSPLTSARKLDTQEDDNDRREREILNATMKLMGIEPAPSPTVPSTAPPLQKSFSSPAVTPAAAANRRFSFFGNRPAADNSDASSVHSTGSVSSRREPSSLTQEALAQAEIEEKLATLDAHERQLSAEMARGVSGSAFTEIAPRRPRSRKSGSGSTVFSAGMSRGEGGDSDH